MRQNLQQSSLEVVQRRMNQIDRRRQFGIYVSPTGEALRIWVALGPQCLGALFSNMAACSTVSSRWYLAFHSA
jgi:hypothetical protein